MPRHSDPETEGRILEAARKLWRRGGEKALSMRAVARLARTNTPAVYRRFRHREDILRALVQSYQMEIFRKIEACGSLQEAVQCYLDFALQRPREYELLMSGLLPKMTKTRPTLDLAIQRSAEWLGGSPADNRGLVLLLGALTHGTALSTITGLFRDEDIPLLHRTFSRAVDLLIKNAAELQDNKGGPA